MTRRGIAIYLGLLLSALPALAAPFPRLLYILQAEKFGKTKAEFLQKASATGRNLVVMDYSYDGSDVRRWRSAEIQALRQSTGAKILAYFSVGEAENYRFYWQKSWNQGGTGAYRPPFLLFQNRDWSGNYLVAYWMPAWQQILQQYLDRILAAGFDGVYLDRVDAFEDLAQTRLAPPPGGFRAAMAKLVKALADYAHQRSGGFLVFLQNGEALTQEPILQGVISGFGIEDLFCNGNRKQPAGEVQERLGLLLRFRQQTGFPVMLVEYPTHKTVRAYAIGQAERYSLPLLLTDRNLTTAGECH